ncbi:MAG: hypothetical protein AB7N76_10070 [Planctomycetota bacterium]
MTELPPVHSGEVDAAGVAALVSDLQACAQHLQVIPKAHAAAYAAPEGIGLAEGARELLAGRLRGLQVRYRHVGRDWCDTLLSLGEGRFRIVRIEANAPGQRQPLDSTGPVPVSVRPEGSSGARNTE